MLRALQDTRPRSGLFPAVALAALVTVIWTVYIAPLPHYDVDVFLRAGAAVGHGHDPYPPPGSAEVYSGFAYVYPYLMAFGFVPLAWLGRLGASVFIALSTGALFGGTRLAGARDGRTYALVAMASCTITGLQMGTLNAVLFLGLAALWRYRERPVAAGLLAAAVIYAKLFLAPIWLWLVLTRRMRAGAVAAAGIVVLFGVAEATSPVGTHAYLSMLTVLARKEAPLGLSLTGLLVNTGVGFGVATWAARTVATGLLAACWLRFRRTADERVLYAGALAAALVASPIVWSHYLLLLIVPLLVSAPGPGTSLTAFTVLSWFVVTPHRTDLTGFVVGGVVVGLLAAPSLVRVVRGPARRGSPAGGPVPPRSSMTTAAFGMTTAAFGIAALATGVAVKLLATAHGDSGRVVGAYCVLLGVLAVSWWSLAQGRRPTPAAVPLDTDHSTRPVPTGGTAT